jgi:hypothetical protein
MDKPVAVVRLAVALTGASVASRYFPGGIALTRIDVVHGRHRSDQAQRVEKERMPVGSLRFLASKPA